MTSAFKKYLVTRADQDSGIATMNINSKEIPIQLGGKYLIQDGMAETMRQSSFNLEAISDDEEVLDMLITDSYEKLIANMDAINQRVDEINQRASDSQNSHTEIQKLLSEVTAEKEKSSQHLKEIKANYEELKAHMERINQQTSDSGKSHTEIQKLLSEVTAEKEKSAECLKEIEESVRKITELNNSAANQSQNISEIEARIQTNEEHLKALFSKTKELHKTAQELLPGAASAGLASAFSTRKKDFGKRRIVWGAIFFLSIISLFFIVSVLYLDMFGLGDSTSIFERPILYLLKRLALASPFIWLAIYAGRRHSQALRLEEDYAYKEVLSRSFEGYKKQILEIDAMEKEGTDATEKKGTMNLVDKVLFALSLHPDRIYGGKQEDITPTGAIIDGVRQRKREDNENEGVLIPKQILLVISIIVFTTLALGFVLGILM